MRDALPRPIRPLEITVHQDVLCPWSYLADLRLEVVRQEFGPHLRWRFRPFPLRLGDQVPGRRERGRHLAELHHARMERDPAARALSPELWTAGDAPRSSLPALIALEAVRDLGPTARPRLARMLQRVALEQGVNVSRSDVLFELVHQLGLDTGRFERAFRSPAKRELVLREHAQASSRGIRRVPTVVIAGRWMIPGLREVSEYRELILSCLGGAPRRRAGASERPLH